MTKTTSNNRFSTYMKTLLTKYTVFLPFLVLSLCLTAIYAIDHYDYLNLLLSNGKLGEFLIASIALISAIAFIYFLSGITNKDVYFGDIMIFGIVTSSVVYAIYLAFTSLTVVRLIPLCTILPLALTFLVVRVCVYTGEESTGCNKCKVKNLLKGIFDKFTFLMPLFLAFSLTAVVYYLDRHGYIRELIDFVKVDVKLLALGIILLATAIVYVISSMFKTTATLLDLLALSGIYFGLFLFLYAGISDFHLKRTLIPVVLIVVCACVLFARSKYFGTTDHTVERAKEEIKKHHTFNAYLILASRKVEPLLSVVLAFAIAVGVEFVIDFNLFSILPHKSLPVQFAFYGMSAVLALVSLISIIFAIARLKKANDGNVDLILLTCVATGIALTICFAINLSWLLLLISLAFTFISLMFLIIRIKEVVA